MRRLWLWIMGVCCIVALGIIAWAQARKPGLWELTTTMTWQQSPFPDGMQPGGGSHTSQYCVSQQYFDKYGAILPQMRECQVSNIVKKAHSMTADLVCSGRMNGKGTAESSWTDDEHAKGSVHFTGSMQMGADTKPTEWTSTSTSVFKGADCGDVQPLPMPQK